MKKINLILGAVAAVALLASCSNGSKDYKNVKTTDYTYAYTVTGSMTTTDKSGTTAGSRTSVTVQTIKSAIAQCTYSEDALNESNYDGYKIRIGGKAEAVNTVTPLGATTADPSTKSTVDFGDGHWSDWNWKNFRVPAGWYANQYASDFAYYTNAVRNGFWGEPDEDDLPSPLSTSETGTVYNAGGANEGEAFWFSGYNGGIRYKNFQGTYLEINVQDFDGDYFIQFNNEFIPLPEDAFDGFIGDDEFTLTYSTKQDNRTDLSETDHTNAAGAFSTTDVEYKLTFKLVEAE